jgi:tRNA modification GTPase
LIEAISYTETAIDFAEEEIPQNMVEKIQAIINELIEKLSTCLKDKKNIDKINNGISVAIIGEPNVGKSSLLNWLAKRDIAIVSPIAGTTRDVISVDLDIKGYKVIFYDTAGIRDTNDAIEQEGVKRAKQIAQNADICLVMTDNVNNISELTKIHQGHDNVIFLLNKADLLTAEQEKSNILNDFIKISVLKEKNLEILLKKIEEKVCEQADLKNSPMIINERHLNLLTQCIEALKRINFKNTPIEIIGEELRFASNCIGQITGEIYTDDILDNIFSKFCIGK